MYVEAYWNLHKECFSYRPPGGRVTHASAIVLLNPSKPFHGRGRTRKTEQLDGDQYIATHSLLANWPSDQVVFRGMKQLPADRVYPETGLYGVMQRTTQGTF